MAGWWLSGCFLAAGAPLFAFTNHSGHIERGTYLERAGLHTGMFRHQLDGMVQVARFEDEDAAELFLRFGVRAVGDGDLAIFPAQGCGRLRRLQPFTGGEMSLRPQ